MARITANSPVSAARQPAAKVRAEKYPLIEVARAKIKEALAGLAHGRNGTRIAKLSACHVLVDVRGRSSAWYRIRINLQHVPKLRPRRLCPENLLGS